MGCGEAGDKTVQKDKDLGKASRVELAVRTTGSQSLLHSSCRAEHGPKAAALSEEGLRSTPKEMIVAGTGTVADGIEKRDGFERYSGVGWLGFRDCSV